MVSEPKPLLTVPDDLRQCVETLTPAPPLKAMTSLELVRLVAKLRQSELAKTSCGQRLIRMIEDAA